MGGEPLSPPRLIQIYNRDIMNWATSNPGDDSFTNGSNQTRSIQRSPGGKWFLAQERNNVGVEETEILRFEHLDAPGVVDRFTITSPNPGGSVKIAINNSGYIFAIVGNGIVADRGIWRSVDDGENWEMIYNLALLINENSIISCGYDRIYVATYDAFYCSLDNGTTWHTSAYPMGEYHYGGLTVWKPTYIIDETHDYHSTEYVYLTLYDTDDVPLIYRLDIDLESQTLFPLPNPIGTFTLIDTGPYPDGAHIRHSLICEDNKLMYAYYVRELAITATSPINVLVVGNGFGAEQWCGQTFLNGNADIDLNYVDIFVNAIFLAPANIICYLYDTVAGLPVGAPIAQTNQLAFGAVGAGAWNRFTFVAPYTLVNNTTYFVSVETVAPSAPNNYYDISTDPGNPYANGSAFVMFAPLYPPALPWVIAPGIDLLMKLGFEGIIYNYTEDIFGVGPAWGIWRWFCDGTLTSPNVLSAICLEYSKCIGDSVTGVVEEEDLIHIFYTTDSNPPDPSKVKRAYMPYNGDTFSFELIETIPGWVDDTYIQSSIIDGSMDYSGNVAWGKYVSGFGLLIVNTFGGVSPLDVLYSEDPVNTKPFVANNVNFNFDYEINKMCGYLKNDYVDNYPILVNHDTRLLDYKNKDYSNSGEFRHFNDLVVTQNNNILDWEVGLQASDKTIELRYGSEPWYRPRSHIWAKCPDFEKNTSIDTVDLFYSNNTDFPFSNNVWDGYIDTNKQVEWQIVYHFDEYPGYWRKKIFETRDWPTYYRNYVNAEMYRLENCNSLVATFQTIPENWGVVGRCVGVYALGAQEGGYLKVEYPTTLEDEAVMVISVWGTEPEYYTGSTGTYILCCNRDDDVPGTTHPGFVFGIQDLGDGNWDFGPSLIEPFLGGPAVTMGSAPQFRFYDTDGVKIGDHPEFHHFGMVFDGEDEIIKIYLNGTLWYEIESNWNFTDWWSLSPPKDFLIGAQQSSAAPLNHINFYNGRIDEFKYGGSNLFVSYQDRNFDEMMMLEYKSCVDKFLVYSLQMENPTNI